MDVTRHLSSSAEADAKSNSEELVSEKSRCCNVYLLGIGAWAAQTRKCD